MSCTLAVNLSCNESFRICFDGNNLPVLSLPLNIKIPIHDLASALADFQKSAEAPEAPRPPPKAAEPRAAPLAAGGTGGAAAGAGAPPGAAAVGSKPPAAPPAPSAGPPPPPPGPAPPGGAPAAPAPAPAGEGRSGREVPGQHKISWDSSIAEMQPNHDDYVDRTKWKKVNGGTRVMWLLTDESCLRDFKPQPVDPVERQAGRPRAAAPQRRGPAAPAREGSATSTLSSGGCGVNEAEAGQASEGAPATGSAPARSEDESEEELQPGPHPPPPAGPPPPPAAAGPGGAAPPGSAAAGPGDDPAHPSPPPGLPVPAAGSCPAGGPAPAPGGRGQQPQGWSGGGGNKECKQQ